MSSSDLLAQAEANPAQAQQIYTQILADNPNTTDAQILRDKETALVKLGELYRDQKYAPATSPSYMLTPPQECICTRRRNHSFPLLHVLDSQGKDGQAQYVTRLTPRFDLIFVLVRTLLDFFAAIPDSQDIQIHTLTDNIAWAKAEKRVFLKHSLETRLVGLYVFSIHYILP